MKLLKVVFSNLFLLVAWSAFAQDALTLQDEAYGTDSLQKMDVYLLPDRTLTTPVVILVHGGGWMAGDKEACNFMKDFLTTQGINIININYRLATTGKITYREVMADMDLAIDHVLKKADQWQIRKTKYVFWGGSAGGHLAMLYAYKYDKKNVISAVTTLGGPTKLDDIETLSKGKKEDIEGLLPLITGDKWQPENLAQSYQDASPFYAIAFRPTLLMHGEKDNIVPVGQAQIMYTHLKENEVPTELIVLENGGHGGEGTSAETSKKMAVTILKWVQKYGL
ncbi:alpha/beta hydrolase [Dyadobacter sp. CY312]|uniref:alpha/beta hydrolase n=1 Tax=Dyadobacter sp. CY312 TaxID=2907303 RepID=UPI001F3823CD|nr:alpha/beta hydrolase [Dyadobacter sp. CY312]MCE7042604.1 alpha/beta hydrolase [Dyadobacter sp. CY312]